MRGYDADPAAEAIRSKHNLGRSEQHTDAVSASSWVDARARVRGTAAAAAAVGGRGEKGREEEEEAEDAPAGHASGYASQTGQAKYVKVTSVTVLDAVDGTPRQRLTCKNCIESLRKEGRFVPRQRTGRPPGSKNAPSARECHSCGSVQRAGAVDKKKRKRRRRKAAE